MKHPPEYSGVFDADLQTPLSNGLVADYDPALCQRVFNISEAQAESVVEPNSMADDFWRKSVSVIEGAWLFIYPVCPHRLNLTIPSDK